MRWCPANCTKRFMVNVYIQLLLAANQCFDHQHPSPPVTAQPKACVAVFYFTMSKYISPWHLSLLCSIYTLRHSQQSATGSTNVGDLRLVSKYPTFHHHLVLQLSDWHSVPQLHIQHGASRTAPYGHIARSRQALKLVKHRKRCCYYHVLKKDLGLRRGFTTWDWPSFNPNPARENDRQIERWSLNEAPVLGPPPSSHC